LKIKFYSYLNIIRKKTNFDSDQRLQRCHADIIRTYQIHKNQSLKKTRKLIIEQI